MVLSEERYGEDMAEEEEEKENEGMTATEESRLIEYLRAQNWTDAEILKLIMYIRG